MAKPLSILFVSSEVYPFIKAGGVGDVSYSLPLALREFGHDVRVMFPKYGVVSERRNKIHEINRLRDIPIPVGKNSEPATVKSSSVNNPRMKVQAYITTNTKYFDAIKGIYADAKTGIDYPNNDERFLYFCRTVLDTCLILGWFPDIIHCNDWQAAIIPAFMRTMHAAKFKKTRTLFTIHNFYNQGVFAESTFEKTNLGKAVFDNVMHKKNFNFMKAGLMYSDRLTTVSPNYAEEILKESKYSNGLSAVLAERADKFVGIRNGIDIWTWNPRTDILLDEKFDDDFFAFKNANKAAMLREFKLEPKLGVPTIGMVSRVCTEKGVELFIENADAIFENNLQIVFLGDGDSEMKAKLKLIQKKYPKKFSTRFEFDETLAHKIEAGSDMFLMPSLYEPCGLNAMYSLAYGSVPIVRATGGLADTVKDCEKSKGGNGFTFRNANSADLLKAIKRATDYYQNPDEWAALAERGMKGDFSWNEGAKKYDEIYYQLMKDGESKK